MPQQNPSKPKPLGQRPSGPKPYTPGTFTPQTFKRGTSFTPGTYRGGSYTPGTYTAPGRDYGGAIPPEALELAEVLRGRAETANSRILESELLGFGGADEVSSPMARFEALRGAELQGNTNASILDMLRQSAEAGRQRRHEAGLQDHELATRRYLTGEELGTRRYLTQEQLGTQRFMQGEELGTRRYMSDAANELQAFLEGERGRSQRYMQGEELGTRRDMQGREIGSRHYLDSQARRERYDDREIEERRRNQEILIRLLSGAPSQTGRSGSGGFGIGLPWG